jgi:Tol biopolymer transport system component
VTEAWPGDGSRIAYTDGTNISNRGNTDFDFDIWAVRVSGGAPIRLTGTAGTGDFDPAYYGNRLVAFDAFTPPSR